MYNKECVTQDETGKEKYASDLLSTLVLTYFVVQ